LKKKGKGGGNKPWNGLGNSPTQGQKGGKNVQGPKPRRGGGKGLKKKKRWTGGASLTLFPTGGEHYIRVDGNRMEVRPRKAGKKKRRYVWSRVGGGEG